MSIRRTVVYFAFLGEEGTDDETVRRRLGFMDVQLRWLADLLAIASGPVEVLVPYVAPRAWDGELHRAIGHHGFLVDPASISADRRNRFEYPGLLAAKRLAERSSPQDLIYYCHSKGIVQLARQKMGLFRLHTHVGLTADLALLTDDPALSRAGLFPSRWGWCWYNFFWIKAGHMAGIAVEESDDRYHFEALIGDRRDKEGYRGVLPLIDRLPFEATQIAVQPWYRPADTTSPALAATHDLYAGLMSPPDAVGC